jgi:hypothetical protein
LKILKSILLVGNDWLLHVMTGAYFTYTLGWPGLVLAFIWHFPIDMIPHGHVKSAVKDALKGIIAAVAISLYTWHVYDFKKVFLVGMGILAAIFFDLILKAANFADKKKIWEKRPGTKWLVRLIIQLNLACHWFGHTGWFRNLWKEKEINNCGVEGNGLKVSWWNIAQLIVAIAVFTATYRYF